MLLTLAVVQDGICVLDVSLQVQSTSHVSCTMQPPFIQLALVIENMHRDSLH